MKQLMKQLIGLIVVTLIMCLINGCASQSKYPIGKDTVEVAAGGRFQIGKFHDGLKLVAYDENINMMILDYHVTEYKKKTSCPIRNG